MIREKRLKARIEELDQDERLIADSIQACTCFEIIELMRDSVSLFDDIVRFDEHFRIQVYTRSAPYSTEIASAIDGLFEGWHGVASRTIALFKSIQQDCCDRGHDLVHFEALQSRFEECDAAIDPCEEDTQFADEAVAQHRDGRTVAM